MWCYSNNPRYSVGLGQGVAIRTYFDPAFGVGDLNNQKGNI